MLAISLLLHGAFLFMPLPTAPEPPLDAEEIEEEPVELSLESLIAPPPAPGPSPQAAAPQPAATVTATPAPVPQAQPVYTPPPQATPEPSPVEQRSAGEKPTVDATPAEAAEAAPPAVPEESPFDPLPLQEAFASNLNGLDGDLTAQGIAPSPITFEEPEQFFASRSVGAEPLPGIHQMRWLNDRRPADVSTELQQRYAGSDMTFVEVPEGYGGGELFAIQNSEGQIFFYLNIVPGKGGASTVLVVWGHNPNEPAPVMPAAM